MNRKYSGHAVALLSVAFVLCPFAPRAADDSGVMSFYLPRVASKAVAEKKLYRFQLTKGKNLPVCRAYQKRLELTVFEKPPFCGRPENSSIPGFTSLRRVPLSPERILFLDSKMESFSFYDDQYFLDRAQMEDRKRGIPPRQTMTLDYFKRHFLENGYLEVWRYNPEVSIENDGKKEDLIIWSGAGLASGAPKCGNQDPPKYLPRSHQFALVLNAKGDAIDVEKTMAIFGSRYPYSVVRPGVPDHRPRMIGPEIGIFEYKGTYYFDTFFDVYGDFDNRRANHLGLLDTLGVFVRKNNVTTQMCEYKVSGKHYGVFEK